MVFYIIQIYIVESKLDGKFKRKMDENFFIGYLSDLNFEENILGNYRL